MIQLIKAMLIDTQLIKHCIQRTHVQGIVHIGANTCQELSLYVHTFGIPENRIVWIEAIPRIVEEMKRRGVNNMYQAVLDETPGEVQFNITSNNGESSSILQLNTHKRYYPTIVVNETLRLKTQTLGNFIDANNINRECLDFLVLDIQGAELRVLRGSPEVLKNVKLICTEVNTEELYSGAGLFDDLQRFLQENGFECISSVVNERHWGDALFIKKDLIHMLQ